LERADRELGVERARPDVAHGQGDQDGDIAARRARLDGDAEGRRQAGLSKAAEPFATLAAKGVRRGASVDAKAEAGTAAIDIGPAIAIARAAIAVAAIASMAMMPVAIVPVAIVPVTVALLPMTSVAVAVVLAAMFVRLAPRLLAAMVMAAISHGRSSRERAAGKQRQRQRGGAKRVVHLGPPKCWSSAMRTAYAADVSRRFPNVAKHVSRGQSCVVL